MYKNIAKGPKSVTNFTKDLFTVYLLTDYQINRIFSIDFFFQIPILTSCQFKKQNFQSEML